MARPRGITSLNDIGINHRYIKPRTPKRNIKVERFHKTDKMDFYQLLTYKNDAEMSNCLNGRSFIIVPDHILL